MLYTICQNYLAIFLSIFFAFLFEKKRSAILSQLNIVRLKTHTGKYMALKVEFSHPFQVSIV